MSHQSPSFVGAMSLALAAVVAPLGAQAPHARIDTLYVMLGGGVAGHIDTLSVRGIGRPADEHTLIVARPRGTAIAYAFRPDSGFQNVQVRFDGTPGSTSGSVALDGSQHVSVMADRIVRLDGRNKPLYDLMRAELTATDVVMAVKRINCEEGHLFATYPESLATRLIDDADYLAVDPIQDAKALDRVGRALDGRVLPAGCDTLSHAQAKKPPAR